MAQHVRVKAFDAEAFTQLVEILGWALGEHRLCVAVLREYPLTDMG